MTHHDYSIIVIGAGSGGLVVSIGAAKFGKKVLLIEKGNYGGDCTNFGCIPSKSLIEAAHIAYAIKNGEKYGIKASINDFDAGGTLRRVQEIVHHFRELECPESLAKHGVETLTGIASFENSKTLKVILENGSQKILTAENFVIATGSYPIIPPIPGLSNISYLTNETIFEL